MKLLIVGVNGMLGNSLAKTAYKKFEVVGTYNNSYFENNHNDVKLDVTNQLMVDDVIKEASPDLVVNCTAITNVDACEDNPSLAEKVHVDGTKFLAAACKKTGSKFIHISTDFVFDGTKGSYSENDEATPVNVYGKTKLSGEKYAGVVLRTCIFGKNLENKKSMVEWIVDSLSNGKEITAFGDSFFTPIYTGHLSEIIMETYRKDLAGLFHVASTQRVDKFTFAKAVAEVFKLDSSLLKKGSAKGVERKARRPADTSLDCSKIMNAGVKLKDFKDEIKMMKNDEL